MLSSSRDLFEFSGLEQAADKQQRLSAHIKTETPAGFNPALICGLDAAYAKDTAVGAAIVWDPFAQKVVEIAKSQHEVSVDYRPGFFGFREGSLLVDAVARLNSVPDVFLIDGHGIAHPRRFGLASHVGLAIDRPSIGVAKSHFHGTLVGENIVDANDRVIGKLLTGRTGRSCYVSVGHKISLDRAVEVVERCGVDNYPVPLRIAHSEAVRLRESL